MKPAHKSMPLAERIERRIIRGEGCWLWDGNHRDGYPCITAPGKVHVLISRYMLESSGVALANGQLACHHCDNPGCVNPAHLYAGDHHQNMVDMFTRGRHGMRVVPIGDYESIRARYRAGETQRAIAKEYGVTGSLISLIVLHRKGTKLNLEQLETA